MWEERIKRLAILILVGGLLVLGIQKITVLKKEEKKPVSSSGISEVKRKIEDFGDKVLGQTIEMIPGYPKYLGEDQQKAEEDKKIGGENQSEEVEENKKSNEGNKEEEENIIQTEKIIEILKQLPQQELERVKKEVFKEFCRQVLEE